MDIGKITVNIKDYLSYEEIESIITEELENEIRNLIKQSSLDIIISNTAYKIVFKAIDEQMEQNYDSKSIIATKVTEVLNDINDFHVFKKRDNITNSEDSLATIYLKKAVEQHKGIIYDKVENILKQINEDDLRYIVEANITNIIMKRLTQKQ